ncbi:MAG: hypothetical protein DYH18_00215 [Xanthomonadales bacterium PRO7]|jgi:tellurite resistance-related uncharacterized protein|nr:hypothetical protein [Xanthomonadales bacterium PRO7]HMM56328.1 hemerythrin domain-containing protein [Rudaea sp.]
MKPPWRHASWSARVEASGTQVTHLAEPSARRRQLGRSRTYTSTDLPARLRRWHAPRANRWVRILVDAGALDVEWLDADGITAERLKHGSSRWIEPGLRWRIADSDASTQFRLEVHADESSAAAAPQPLRAALLDDAPVMQVDDAVAFTRVLANLEPGTHNRVRSSFDFSEALREAMRASGDTLCWHPLHDADGERVALISRSAQAIGLPEYLGLDHAVIEAALAGALRGNIEHMRWLRSALARHLWIEEDVLFPAYLAAGGNAGWVRGLHNEHQHLRAALEHLEEPASQRRFLLLLDGHDEKEEQIVYPDIAMRLGARLGDLSRQIMGTGVIEPSSTANEGSRPETA